MIYDIVISDQAEIDLHGIFEYIAFELQAPENASGQLNRLEVCIMDLDHMPKRYRQYECSVLPPEQLQHINYKKIFTQKVQHQEFMHKLDEFMEHHNDEVEDQDEQIMGILKYLTEWLVNHILYVDGQIPKD